MDTKVKDLIASSIGKIHELSDADTIIGDPIKIDGNITIIPVSKISPFFELTYSNFDTSYFSSKFAATKSA